MTQFQRHWMNTLKDFASLVTAVTTAVTIAGYLCWWIAKPHIRPYLTAIERLATVEVRIAELEQNASAKLFLDFQSNALVEPVEVRPGGRITITYHLRRNLDCYTDVITRFYSLDENAFDYRFTKTTPSMQAPIGQDFRPFRMILSIPSDLPAGSWAYLPELRPNDGCARPDVVIPPPAYFTVVDADS